jgi:predicted ArsR family transcriptional regulator
MDVPVRPGDVLAQPTRARLFSVLVQMRRPASTDELANRLGLHRNGVRAHLERMAAAGLVERRVVRQARGRPRDVWSVAAGAHPAGDPPSAYADLGRWLTRLIASRRASSRAVEELGRAIGRDLAPPAEGAAEGRMFSTLAALGFAPERMDEPEDGLTYRLCNCPYRDAAHESQEVICGLHRGMTRGLLDELAPETALVGFVPHDPSEAGCLIELRGGLAAQRADAANR